MNMQGMGLLFNPNVPTGLTGPLLAAWQAGAHDAQLLASSTQIVGGRSMAPQTVPVGSQIVGGASTFGRVADDGFRPRTPPRDRPFPRGRSHRRHPYGNQGTKGDQKGKRPHAPAEPPPEYLSAAAAAAQEDAEESAGPGTFDAFPAVPPPNSPDREHFLVVLREYVQANLTVSEVRSLLT